MIRSFVRDLMKSSRDSAATLVSFDDKSFTFLVSSKLAMSMTASNVRIHVSNRGLDIPFNEGVPENGLTF